MTSCDESTNSVNGSPVAESYFVVIGEDGVENKAVTAEENTIINTIFSLIWLFSNQRCLGLDV